MENENKLRELYNLAELSYKKKFNNYNDVNIFPVDWYKYNKYKEKIEIIYESLKNNELIENTELYKEYLGNSKCLSRD